MRTATWEADFATWTTQVYIDPQTFAWGSLDCCLLAADGVKAVLGVDIASAFRGRYYDKATAFSLIQAVAGGTTVADAAAWCASEHGLEEWSMPLFVRRGDLVVIKNDDGLLIAGIVSLSGRSVIAMGESGAISLPVSQVVRAWKVQ